MEPLLAICPMCNKQIDVNLSENVDLCKYCGKPFVTKEARKLYTEYVDRNEAAKVPSDEELAKFNAILTHDYKLAEQYLNNIIKKVYSPESQKLLSFNNKSEVRLNEIRSINPFIASLHYKLLRADIEALFKEKYYHTFTGELTFLKLCFMDLKKRFDDINNYISAAIHARRLIYDEYDDEIDNTRGALDKWRKIENDVKRFKHLQGKEFDDEYIFYIINFIKNYSNGHYISIPDFLKNAKHASKYLGDNLDIKSLNDLITHFSNFLSPVGKVTFAAQQAAEAKKREEIAKYQKEFSFWKKYTELLKAGNAKKAFDLLEKTKTLSETDEFTKFKKGLFGLKYTGDAIALNAEALTKDSLGKF